MGNLTLAVIRLLAVRSTSRESWVSARYQYSLGTDSASCEPRVGEWLYAQAEGSLFLSTDTIGELRKGIELREADRRRGEIERWFEDDLIVRFFDRILPVTRTIGNQWGTLSARRQKAGMPLSAADGLIAATALEHDLTLVTRNVKDFTDLGVTILNPWEG